MFHLAVLTGSPDFHVAAQQLAQQLKLPLLDKPDPSIDYLLRLDEAGLSLIIQNQQITKPFYLDFSKAKIMQRSAKATKYNELIVKAVGQKNKFILDATAGFGYDAFLLASVGHQVTLIEQSPLVSALLEDALRRASHCAPLNEIAQRMHPICANSLHHLNALMPESKPDVIYLDPMFPASKKTAKSKKEMQILQHLIGESEDSNLRLLFESALQHAKNRVVVKRPRIGHPLCHTIPAFSLCGKAIRFDIYLCHLDKAQNSSIKQSPRSDTTI
ncbi:MAG: hypothetical protein A2X77_00835 [Gammaproteobacteria bacterium GWE2_42_36]|nr:MAG: hypothetical protein A2X77_00835 [Gammaproteobacteria bacterium GWE2_42_36]HCU05915.1 hypothetical protein [Coxiellaceae bacterium]